MSKKNYRDMYEPKTESEVVEEVTEVTEPVEKEEVKETATKTKTGVVIDCSKLNIRENPSIGAKILCEVKVGDKLTINTSKNNKEWYKVCTESGVEGFCMKKYVTVTQ